MRPKNIMEKLNYDCHTLKGLFHNILMGLFWRL